MLFADTFFGLGDVVWVAIVVALAAAWKEYRDNTRARVTKEAAELVAKKVEVVAEKAVVIAVKAATVAQKADLVAEKVVEVKNALELSPPVSQTILEKLSEVHLQVNGMKEELVRAVAEGERAKGILEGRAQAEKRSD